MSRGMLLHNPLNIERNGIQWEGLAPVQDDPVYCAFVDLPHCYRAGTKIFMAYQARGLNSAELAISSWAPPNENPTDTYTENMCQWCGVTSYQIVDFHDPTFLLLWLRGITRQEQGEAVANTIDSSVIRQGISMALQ